MAQETGKACARRAHDHRFATRYYVGRGIDIGAGNDTIAYYQHMFPLMTEVTSWDIAQGDAMLMEGVPDDSFDWVNSSHCLEHLVSPTLAIDNWIRITKPGGHLIIVVPDVQLYEHGIWPSVRNPDHKWAFTMDPEARDDPAIRVLSFLSGALDVIPLKIELLDAGFRYGIDEHRIDQSAYVVCEPAIEIVLRKVK